MTSLKKLFRWVSYFIGFLLLIAVLIALVLRFAIFPNIDQYKNDIAAFATKTVGQKITIGNIYTTWDNYSPHVALFDVDLYDAENRAALKLSNVEATVSWLSVPLLRPRLAKLIVNRPELTIRREMDGSIYLAGMNLAGESKPEFANWLLRQSQVKIKDAQIIWQDDLRQAPPLALKQLNLTLSNPAWQSVFGQHKFTVQALPSIGSNQPIEASGRFVGSDVSKMQTWHGELFLQLKQADLAVWRPWLDYTILNNPVDIQSGTGDAKVWLDFADAKIEKVKTHAVLNNLSLTVNKQTTPFVAKQFTGDIGWSDFKNTQTISLQNIKLSTNTGLNLNNGSGYYSTSNKNGKQWIKADLKLDQFDLATIKQLAPYFNLPDNVTSQLNGFSPVGQLQTLALRYEGDANKPSRYKINTTFKNLGITAYQKIPGFSNFTGSIEADEDGGKVTLNTEKAMVELKDVLRWPVPIDKLTGQVDWTIDSDKDSLKGKINVKEVFVTNPHISGTVNANYDMNGIKGGYLDLTGKFGKGNAKYALNYYPLSLGKDTLHWLDTSILAGRIEDVDLIIQGNLDEFPFVDKKGRVDKKIGLLRASAKLSDALIDYGEGWPVIEGLATDMLFEGTRMELNASKGNILGTKIIKCKAEVAQLDADWPMLHVVSTADGSVPEIVKFVNQSPVKLVTQGFTDDLKTAGDGKLSLELKIPLENVDSAKYKGSYKITNGTLFANDDIGLPELSKLNGALNFTETSFGAQNINADIYGGPAQFSLRSGADKVLLVTGGGRIAESGIKKIISTSLLDHLQGSTTWTGDLTIKKPAFDLNIHSDLVGMAILLPAPFNKPANQAMAFNVSQKQISTSSESFNINYGKIVSAKLLYAEQAGKLVFERGDIGINIAAETPSQLGLSLRGKLDQLEADDWLALLNKPSNKADASPITIKKADFAIQKLDIFGRRINALKVIAQSNVTGLQMAIDSQEIVGNAEWQSEGNGKIIARLKNLNIPNTSDNKVAVKKEIRKLSNGYPALDVTAENFQLGNKNLGSLELNAFATGDDWTIQKVKITNPDSTLTADGSWHNWTRNPNTNLKFALNISNIGNTLKRFGQPDAVKGGEAEISGQLIWPGSPHEFETSDLDGNIKLEAKKGQFLKVQPGVGRLFGLLSLQSLPRRLSLDFRDLFSEGFAFDKISATAVAKKGILYSNDFFMTGPAAEAKINGETNLKTETQNLKVKVRPHVSDSLSLAALAGGPIVGAAAFVAQKILKDPFNKIIQSEYTITGTWDKPVEVELDKNEAKKLNDKSPLSP